MSPSSSSAQRSTSGARDAAGMGRRVRFAEQRGIGQVQSPQRVRLPRHLAPADELERVRTVDADTGEEVSNDDIIKGFKVDTDTYIEMSKDELENIALESTRTIDIDEFVPKSSIDPRYLIRPYYLVPDGKVGHDAFAVIRETIRNMDMSRSGALS
jgi:Ku70/Ku80 beta-barrel domain